MRLIHQQDAASPLTAVMLVVPRSGVCLDPAPLQGLSRLTLRLAFMGADGLSHEALSGRLERLGANMGASVFSDHVVLRLATLTENLEPALDLFMASVLRPDFDGATFERLQGELVSAWVSEREESKQVRAQDVYRRRSYRDAPPGFSPDGTLAGLRAATLADVRAQYRRLLAGREAVCAVLSDLPREAVEARVLPRVALPEAQGDDAAAAGPFPWDGFTVPDDPPGRHVTLIEDARTSTDEVMLGGFSAARSDPDWHLHRLVAYVFGGDMNSRLFRVVRGERGLSYGASCWYEAATGRVPPDRPAPFTVYTFPSVEHTAEAVPLVLNLYERLVADGITDDELALARSALVNSHPFKRDTPSKLLHLQVEEALYGVTTDDVAENKRKLEAATPADVRRVLQAAHHPERLEIVLLGDPARLEPIAAKLPGVAKVDRIRYPEGEQTSR